MFAKDNRCGMVVVENPTNGHVVDRKIRSSLIMGHKGDIPIIPVLPEKNDFIGACRGADDCVTTVEGKVGLGFGTDHIRKEYITQTIIQRLGWSFLDIHLDNT
jgi:hypothetical protein